MCWQLGFAHFGNNHKQSSSHLRIEIEIVFSHYRIEIAPSWEIDLRVPRRRAVCWQLGDGVAHRPRVTSCCLKSLGEIQFLDATRSSRFLSFFSFPPFSRQLFCPTHLNDPCPLSSSPFVPIIRDIQNLHLSPRCFLRNWLSWRRWWKAISCPSPATQALLSQIFRD